MTTWEAIRSEITSIPETEMQVIELLADLYSERIRRGISQKEFAERIGMKPSQLAKLERLDSVPTLTTLNRYAKGLGLNSTWSAPESARGRRPILLAGTPPL